MPNEDLLLQVNPVFVTARSCLQIMASTGDEDSVKLLNELGFDEMQKNVSKTSIPQEMLSLITKMIPAFYVLVELRFTGTNKIIEKTGAKCVLDLPCGYTTRGITLSKSGVRYFGADLPAVINEIGPAVKKFTGENSNITYKAVDATNYASLKEAVAEANGELFITTEGMLMYFSQSELEEVFGNIRRLLLEYGGRWVTCDNTFMSWQNVIIANVLGIDPDSEDFASLGIKAASILSKADHANNTFFDKNTEKVKKFISDMGFELEALPAADYMPDVLHSLENLPEETVARTRQALGKMDFWVMTPKPSDNVSFSCETKDFKADMTLSDGRLEIDMKGRLDTITAPELLRSYREAAEKEKITDICIDMKDTDYISSAGLRVLLIMYKALDGDTHFRIENMNKTVQDIMDTTGFSGVFC